MNIQAVAAVGFAGLALAMWDGLRSVPGLKQLPATVRQIAETTAANYGLAVNPTMLVAMASIESGFNPYAFRLEPQIGDASVGLMQTLLGTARDMFDKGYRAFNRPDYADLTKAEVSMYFGAAYVDWLQKWHRSNRGSNPTEEWLVRAYNGGPGWQKSAKAVSMTANHWAKYQQAKRRLA